MAYIEYRVAQSDTLESIALRFLGSSARWDEVASLNGLRYPFISDDPIQQYGQPIISSTLSTAIIQNATTYGFSVGDMPVLTTTYAANCVFFAQSGVNSDAMTLASAVNETTGLLTFRPSVSFDMTDPVITSTLAQTISVNNLTGVLPGMLVQVDAAAQQETVTILQISGPDDDVADITAVFTKTHIAGTTGTYGFQHGYPLGATFTLFGPQPDNQLRVLRTGDPVRLPATGVTSGIAQTGDGLFANLLGRDLLVDQDGLIVMGVNGDVQRVSGTKNMAQALRLRLRTALRSYIRYPEYGNAMWDFVGQTSDPVFATLVEGLTRQALLSDPRVGAVRDIQVTINGATVVVDASVQIIQTTSLLRLENLIVNR
jgi:phage baseplate assembly protein W